MNRSQLPPVSHSTPMQKKQASAILTPNPPPTRPQLLASDEVATPSDTGSLDDQPPMLDAADSENAEDIPKPHCMEVKQTTPIATEDQTMYRNSHANIEGELQLPKMCSQESDSADPFDSLSNTLSAYHDNLKMQSSQFTPFSSLPIQHCSSHPDHTGWSSSGPQLNMGDVKERLSGSDSATDATGGAHDGSCVVDHSSASSFPLKLSKQSQSQSGRLTGLEHTSKSAHSHSEAQSGAGIQSRTTHGTHTPDQRSMASHSLWKITKIPAGHTPAEVSSLIQSQHQEGSADNAEKSVCVLAPGLHLHSEVVATSEPVIDVKGSCDLSTLHHSLQKPSAPAPLARSPGPVHSSVTPPHLSSQHPSSTAPLALPHSPGSVNTSGTLPHVSSQQLNPLASLAMPRFLGSTNTGGSLPHISLQQTNSSLSLTLPPSPEGFPNSEPEECDSTAHPLKPPATNSAQFLQMQNSSLTGFPATSDQTHPSLSIIPTKEHSLMGNLASHPTQQTASDEDSLHGETSDDDGDDDAHSDLTYQSSTTSGSTIRNPTTEDSRNSSLSHTLHPPFLGMQPRTASLTPAVATAGSGEMTSFVDMHPAVGPHSNVTGDKQPQNSDQSAQALMNSRERQLAAHHSQQPTTHPNPSVNVLSHLEPAVVGLPPSKVPSMIDKSAEKYWSAATVVEAAREADMIGAPASSSTAKQAVSCKVGSSAVPSKLPDVHQQNSGYLGRNQYASSNIIHQHFGSMDFFDRIQMDSYQREQDSQGT